MTHGRKTLVCMLGSLVVCAGAKAVVADNSDGTPYQAIVDRNVFGLKPPPPPPSPEANKPPAPKITLTGITTILGNKRALLKTPPPPAKPGEQAKGEQFYMLTEGQRDGQIEVLEIDEKAGSVKVNNSGDVVTLTFEKDGNKASSPPPGTPGMAGQIPAPAGFNRLPATGITPGVRPLPTRIPRTGTPMGTQSSASPPAATSGAEAAPAPLSSGTANYAGTSVAPAMAPGVVTAQPVRHRNWPPEEPLPAGQQEILMELAREQHRNDPNYPPLPTTSLTPGPVNTAPGNMPIPMPQGPPRAPSLPPILPQ